MAILHEWKRLTGWLVWQSFSKDDAVEHAFVNVQWAERELRNGKPYPNFREIGIIFYGFFWVTVGMAMAILQQAWYKSQGVDSWLKN